MIFFKKMKNHELIRAFPNQELHDMAMRIEKIQGDVHMKRINGTWRVYKEGEQP